MFNRVELLYFSSPTVTKVEENPKHLLHFHMKSSKDSHSSWASFAVSIRLVKKCIKQAACEMWLTMKNLANDYSRFFTLSGYRKCEAQSFAYMHRLWKTILRSSKLLKENERLLSVLPLPWPLKESFFYSTSFNIQLKKVF